MTVSTVPTVRADLSNLGLGGCRGSAAYLPSDGQDVYGGSYNQGDYEVGMGAPDVQQNTQYAGVADELSGGSTRASCLRDRVSVGSVGSGSATSYIDQRASASGGAFVAAESDPPARLSERTWFIIKYVAVVLLITAVALAAIFFLGPLGAGGAAVGTALL